MELDYLMLLIFMMVIVQDITELYIKKPYKEKSIDKKMQLMNNYINEFEILNKDLNKDKIIIFKSLPNMIDSNITYYFIKDRKYTKSNS